MPIQLIANVIYYKNKLLIGKENDLIIKSSEDLKYFKNITTYNNCIDNNIASILNSNVILMGRKTWFSIPLNYRPLKDRINIVLTNDPSLLKLSKKAVQKFFKTKILDKTKVYFVNMKTFIKIYNATVLNVFVIGGGEVYNMFLKQDLDSSLRPQTLYITEVKDYFKYNTYDDSKIYNYIEHIPGNYKLTSVSSKYTYEKDNRITYRFLKYKLSNQPSQEKIYIDMLKNILNNGNKRIDRTGVGTISIFGTQMRFDISQTIPLLTTRNIPMKVIIEELLWFLRGDTNANILKNKGVNIWNQNTSREFLDSRGLNHYDEGVLGPGYGFQMRFFGGEYSQIFSDTSLADTGKIGGFDQLMYVLNTLKTDPFSRRIMMSYWNPPDFEKTALIPCHVLVQFYVEENPIKGEKHLLSCHFYMRSNDFALANNFNIISYSVLTYILALKCDMLPKEIIYSCGDTHVYNNHIEPIKQQLERDPRPFPVLLLNDDIKYKDFKDITFRDFEVCGYYPYANIKLSMAV
jgi:dihydrofolate reductase/thymidylate synthase